jgi:sec-independent protein translocase protein TatB
MFEIGWGELLVIGIVALIAIGPKELPGVLRMVGQWMGKARRMANEFQDQFREAMREAEMTDLKKQVDEMTSTASSFTNFDPLESARQEIESVVGDQPVSATPAEPVPPTASAAPSAPAAASAAPETPPSAPPPQPKEGPKAGEGA